MTGDSLLAQNISQISVPEFLNVKNILRKADVSYTNIEFTTPKGSWVATAKNSGPTHTLHVGADPSVLECLQYLGFNIFSAANNHSFDYSAGGLLDTLAELDKRNMICAGIGVDLAAAEEPKFLTADGFRVAIVAAASSFTPGAIAGASRGNMPGRPGLNPMRNNQYYMLDSHHFNLLKELDQSLGTAAITAKTSEIGLLKATKKYKFLGHDFVLGEKCAIISEPHPNDLKRLLAQVHFARRQADLVLVTLHCHDGQDGNPFSVHPAAFARAVARKCVEAGADIFIGHGPHVLRPMEIYLQKPIFYSLGNFLFTTEALARMPADTYEELNLGNDATPADVHDFWTVKKDGSPNIFMTRKEYWQTILPVCDYRNNRLESIKFYPLVLGQYSNHGLKGVPTLASGPEAFDILYGFQQMSFPYGVKMDIDDSAKIPIMYISDLGANELCEG